MESKSKFGLASLVLLLAVAEAAVFDVTKNGAVPNGGADNTKAFLDTFKQACAAPGPERSTVLVPKGSFLVGPVKFEGPCKAPVDFEIQGIVKADPEPSKFDGDWIVFQRLTDVNIGGGGTFDGQGQKAWAVNDCASKSAKCHSLPVGVRFNYLTNAFVSHLTSKDAKNFHMNILECKNITLQSITISAPENAPNTDGIHMGRTSQVKILDTTIATGDDCVSIGDGSVDITVQGVTCGPGHGISVGSLGKYPNESPVDGVTVRNCTLIGTMNGVRIKTWPKSQPGSASNFIFEDIVMDNVGNPINIDQLYCPYAKCGQEDPSKVKISHVNINKIRGTTKTKNAISIVCSKGTPCEDVRIGDVNLVYTGTDGPATSVCTFANPILTGTQTPTITATSS